jgi:hypothetical protein
MAVKTGTILQTLVLAGLMLLMSLASGHALEIRETTWGFNGLVVPDRFNLLSVLVVNDSPKPFDGTLELFKSHGFGSRIGATYSEPIYLGGFGSRWVQFHPRITQEMDWELRWGPGPFERYELPRPREGPPARVFLQDAADPQRPPAGLRVLPDHLFPVTVAATDGLHSVVLDHLPRWEPARRTAFLDWTRAGGIVHLLPGSTGQHPVFADDLAGLNSNRTQHKIGAGWVVRHAEPRSGISDAGLSDAGYPMPTLEASDQIVLYQLDDMFLRALAPLTRARHSWGLLYTLAVVYLLAVGPGHYLLARRLRDYRLTTAVFLLGVGGFALLMNFAGRRGQDEASAVYTMSYARAVGGDQFNVTQWINAFVTRGDYYTIAHPADHNLYAAAQEHEPVNAIIDAGRDGRLLVDLPVFSRRGFLHQARMTGPTIEPRVLDWQQTDDHFALSIEVNDGFPSDTRGIWALHRGTFYPLTRAPNGRLTSEAGDPDFLALDKIQQVYQGHYYRHSTEEPDPAAQMEKLLPATVGLALGGVEGFRKYLSQPASILPEPVRLFVLAASPASFATGHPQLGREIGYTLYHIDLYPPITGDNSS